MALSVAACVLLPRAVLPRLVVAFAPFLGAGFTTFLAGAFVAFTPFFAGCAAFALAVLLGLACVRFCVVAAGCDFFAERFFCAPSGKATIRARRMVRTCFIYMSSILLKTSCAFTRLYLGDTVVCVSQLSSVFISFILMVTCMV